MARRKHLQEKLNELFTKDYEDSGTLAEEIQRLEQETIGEPTRSLVGRIRVSLWVEISSNAVTGAFLEQNAYKLYFEILSFSSGKRVLPLWVL